MEWKYDDDCSYKKFEIEEPEFNLSNLSEDDQLGLSLVSVCDSSFDSTRHSPNQKPTSSLNTCAVNRNDIEIGCPEKQFSTAGSTVYDNVGPGYCQGRCCPNVESTVGILNCSNGQDLNSRSGLYDNLVDTLDNISLSQVDYSHYAGPVRLGSLSFDTDYFSTNTKSDRFDCALSDNNKNVQKQQEVSNIYQELQPKTSPMIKQSLQSSFGSCNSFLEMPTMECLLSSSPRSDLPPLFILPRNAVCRVPFPSRTWESMREGLRIALSVDNVFSCDKFLGEDYGKLLAELKLLDECKAFTNNVLYLMQPETSHGQIDALALLAYKLASYVGGTWTGLSLKLEHWPNGHSERFCNSQETEKLCFLYGVSKDYNSNQVFLKLPNQNDQIELLADRLICFWQNAESYIIPSVDFPASFIEIFVYR